MIRQFVLAALLLALSPSGLLAQSEATPGALYEVVRQSLVVQGHQPLAFPRGASDQCFHREICATYPEVITCSGTGRSYCRFAFRASGGGYLIGTTAGERVEDLRVELITTATEADVRMIENALAGRAW